MYYKWVVRMGAFLIVGGLAVWSWFHFASPQGEQKVKYTPSIRECFGSPEGAARAWKACTHRPPSGTTNGHIAYLLHGRNMDELVWNNDTLYTSMIQQYWSDRKLTPPLVVTVSFGKAWLLAPKGKAPKSGLVEVLADEVIPAVERRTGAPKARLVFGDSMGGINSLVIAMQRPGLFGKTAALCPGLYVDSPFDSIDKMKELSRRTGADLKMLYGVAAMSMEYFGGGADWEKINPNIWIEKADPKTAPEIYLSCGLYDSYGNYEGSEAFAQTAQKRGFKITWRPQFGPHCATDIPSLAEFLAK